MKIIKTKELIYLSLFISLEIILTRFLSIQTPIVRIGFTFIPVVVSAMMFGGIFSAVSAAAADVLGMMIFPSGAYFPGFTFSAFLSGLMYGIFLYKKNVNLIRISAAVIIITIFVNLGLDTLWLLVLTGKGLMLLLPARIIKCMVMIPVQIVTIECIWRFVICRIKYASNVI